VGHGNSTFRLKKYEAVMFDGYIPKFREEPDSSIFYPVDEDRGFFRNINIYLPSSTAPHPRRQQSSYH
jgi:hypothetical protein